MLYLKWLYSQAISFFFQVFGSAPTSLPGPPRGLLHPSAVLADVHFPGVRRPQNLILPKSEDFAKKLSGLQAHFASLGSNAKAPPSSSSDSDTSR